MTHVLGIDAGGSKTLCLLAGADGHPIGEGRARGANVQSVGAIELHDLLLSVIEQALRGHGVTPSVICLGMAGADRERDRRLVRDVVERVGGRMGYRARVLVVNDALVALVAGVGWEPGVVLIAGTGSIAYGRDGHGVAARAGGWGHVLGDEGSGYWLGRLALRAVLREADQRGPRTRLTPRVLSHFGVVRPDDLVRHVYGGAPDPAEIARLAPTVQRACEEDDVVATRIVRRGARELVASVATVVRRLDMENTVFTCLLAGGILQVVPRLKEEIERRLPAVATRCEVKLLEREPAYGAVALALAEAGGGTS